MRGKNIMLNIIVLIVNIIIVLSSNLSEYSQSVLMCLNFIYILWYVWTHFRLTPFFLFLVTFCFLFIGGHFWGNLFSPDLLSTRVGSFMNPVPSTDEEWNKTLIYILIFLYCTLLGYEKTYAKNEFPLSNSIYLQPIGNRNKYQSLNVFLTAVFIPLSFVVINSQYKALLQVLVVGYNAIYSDQSGNYSSNSSLFVLFYFFFAVTMVYGNKKNRILYLILLFLDCFIKILAGGRGSFGSFLMFGMWLYSFKWNISMKKIGILGCIALIFLLGMSQISKRSQDKDLEYNNINDVVGLFVYAQGESLSTFESSRNYTYPAIAYVQTFIPGSGFLYAKLIDTSSKNYESSFSLSLSRHINRKRFEEGDGVGWTVMSDIYLFAGRTWVGFILLSIILGCCFAKIEIKSKKTLVWRVVLFAIFLRLMILPRTGLNYICPMIMYVLVFHSVLSKFFKLKKL